MRRALITVTALAALALTACSDSDGEPGGGPGFPFSTPSASLTVEPGGSTPIPTEDPTSLPTSTGEPSGEPVSERPEPEVVPDRDLAVVDAQVYSLDACAVLERAGMRVDDFQISPHSCASRYDAKVPVTIRLVDTFDQKERFEAERLDLQGITGYVESMQVNSGTQSGTVCRAVHLPTSQRTSISIEGDSSSTCKDLTTAARSVAQTLVSDKAALQLPASPSSISTCALLTKIWGPVAKDQEIATGPYPTGESCSVFDLETDPAKAEYARYTGGPVASLEMRSFLSGDALEAHGFEAGDKAACNVSGPGWTYRNQPAAKDRSRTLLVLQAQTGCPKAKARFKQLLATASKVKTTVPALDHTTYLYGVEENDRTVTGSCLSVRLEEDENCAPAVEASVPQDPQTFLRDADLNANVVCAAARDLVAAAEPELTEVSTVADTNESQRCVFSRPDGSRALSVGTDHLPFEDSEASEDGLELTTSRDGGREDHEVSAEVTVSRPDLPEALTLTLTDVANDHPELPADGPDDELLTVVKPLALALGKATLVG